MYALNFTEHMAWSRLSQPIRRWTRLWLDGNHDGTHIHWKLSPLSILGLSQLWLLLSGLDRRDPQEEAIRRMASRRRHRGSFLGCMPDWGASRHLWETFFSDQIEASADLPKDVLAWHRRYLDHASTSTPSHQELWVAQNELSAALILSGYSSDDLFNRVKDGVVDAAGRTPGTDAERLMLFLNYFLNPTPREYFVWTRVIHDTSWESRTLQQRYSRVLLSHPAELRGDGPTCLWIRQSNTQTPLIVTRLQGTHSLRERHRAGALALLEARMHSDHALGGLSLDAETTMTLTDNISKEWRYGRKRFALPMLEKSLVPDDRLMVGSAAQEIFDRPVEVIDQVFEFFEHRGYREFWRVVPPAYHSCLRRDLGKAIRDYRARLSGVFRNLKAEDLPADVKLLIDLTDFADLEVALSSRSDCPDVVLVERLKEVVTWPHFAASFPGEDKAFNSVHEIADLLTLARGLRNARTHSVPIPFSLHGFAVYLAMTTLYAYSSVVRAQARKRGT